MIQFKFCRWHDWHHLEIIELKTYHEFFVFYVKNADKGCIWGVEDDRDTN